jgi:hypothetical protein
MLKYRLLAGKDNLGELGIDGRTRVSWLGTLL